MTHSNRSCHWGFTSLIIFVTDHHLVILLIWHKTTLTAKMNPMASWRPMYNHDLSAVMLVADEIHPGLPEGASVFAERVELSPEGCFVLESRQEICGYIISHPIPPHCPPALDTLLVEIPPTADHYYIHDLAILPSFQGRRLAAEGIKKVLDVARNYRTTCLISVYGTLAFWRRFGFEPGMDDTDMSAKLRGYGNNAMYLECQNTTEQAPV
ncbi:Putative protein of unknown function [Podospora comata]|uniref:N-acetyltransferase domain-containing protein n=1 Tax=Podospora comata TaxID=48703 RepID=A0ABY6S1F3_PODCO|nr:Putative protein of unknown function [Podospora comata]